MHERNSFLRSHNSLLPRNVQFHFSNFCSKGNLCDKNEANIQKHLAGLLAAVVGLLSNAWSAETDWTTRHLTVYQDTSFWRKMKEKPSILITNSGVDVGSTRAFEHRKFFLSSKPSISRVFIRQQLCFSQPRPASRSFSMKFTRSSIRIHNGCWLKKHYYVIQNEAKEFDSSLIVAVLMSSMH